MLKGMLSIGYSNSWAYGKDATSAKANKRYRKQENTYMWSNKREQYYKNTQLKSQQTLCPPGEEKKTLYRKE
jgi:hypothetical protein